MLLPSAQVDGDGNKYTFQYTPCNPVVCPNTEGASAVSYNNNYTTIII